MAAYAALVSVMQTIDQIQHHPRPPISLHPQQVSSLTEIITFLQHFLEAYNPHLTYTAEADPLETRIAEAANAVEDVIESYIVDRILARSTYHDAVEFYQALQKPIEELDLIKLEVAEIKAKTTATATATETRLQIKNSSIVAANDVVTFRSTTSTAQRVEMVGFDDVLYQMLEQICTGQANLQIIPIVGMGGIGKTTLAQNIYVNPVVEQRFDVRAWSTISHEYNALSILTQLLDQVDQEKEEMGNLSENEVGEELYKYLIGRRYLIVMDDMWSIKAWDRVRKFFPDNENGSRIVITTRLSNLASLFDCSNILEMKFLDDASGWIVFTKIVFGEEICPSELKGIGMEIVRGCKGLPLSIAVIGGLLSKTRPTRENWKFIERNLYSTVNLEDNERCLQILYTSYNNLPVYLKPCFLYMAVFPEDFEIPVFLFIGQWIAEGFLKPINGKSLEEVAEVYLDELVERNLILVETRNHFGKVQSCKMHDLLRDLSLREAQKVKFCCVLQSIHDIPQGINSQRRIASTISGYPPTPLCQSLESASLVRSLIGRFPITLSSNFRLLRVSMFDASYAEKEGIWFSIYGSYIPLMCDLMRSGCRSPQQQKRKMHKEFLRGHVNLRFLCVTVDKDFLPRIPSSVSLFWNLQTVVLLGTGLDYIFKIWKMPQLRHVMAFEGTLDGSYCFPNHPLNGEMDEVVLKNLQTLATVSNLNFGEGVLERIPNIRWLELYYDEISTRRRGGGGGDRDYCLNNLSCLHKLDFLELRYSYKFQQHTLAHMVTFPYSLKELTLEETRLHWEDIKTKIGSLPYLQALQLKKNSFIGSEWETLEDQFSSLKFLLIDDCNDLENWMTDNTHFPCLDHLVLRHLKRLREIPLSIGDIPTLVSIALDHCSDSAVASAHRIIEEQEELGNEGLRLQL